MKVAGAHAVPLDKERLYQLLQDPEALARCMPGCDSLVRTGPDTYQMRMKLAMASISGLFDGTVRIADQNPPDSFRLVVEGRGRIGFLKGDGLLRLTPNGASTEVAYDGEVHAGGTIANVGQRLMDTTARMIIKRFFENLTKAARQ